MLGSSPSIQELQSRNDGGRAYAAACLARVYLFVGRDIPCRTHRPDSLHTVVPVKEMQMFWAFVFVVLAWMAHLVIQAGSLLKTLNLLGFIVLAAGAFGLLRRVRSRRRRLVRQGC